MSKETALFRHITPVQIRFNDVDILGHVNNAIHQYYFDFARMQYFKQVFGKDMNWKKNSLVLVSIKVDYFKPIYIDDIIEVESRIEMLGNKSITMKQKVLCRKTGEVKSSSWSVLVAYDVESNHTVSVPEEWKNRIISYEKEIALKYPLTAN
jgi:acyl-CoA thioester hydrolase